MRETLTNSVLKPCPFCGGSDLEVYKVDMEDNGDFLALAIHCRDCMCLGRHCSRSGWSESDLEAIELWNDRPKPVETHPK